MTFPLVNQLYLIIQELNFKCSEHNQRATIFPTPEGRLHQPLRLRAGSLTTAGNPGVEFERLQDAFNGAVNSGPLT